jgi:hypothetical protein
MLLLVRAKANRCMLIAIQSKHFCDRREDLLDVYILGAMAEAINWLQVNSKCTSVKFSNWGKVMEINKKAHHSVYTKFFEIYKDSVRPSGYQDCPYQELRALM